MQFPNLLKCSGEILPPLFPEIYSPNLFRVIPENPKPIFEYLPTKEDVKEDNGDSERDNKDNKDNKDKNDKNDKNSVIEEFINYFEVYYGFLPSSIQTLKTILNKYPDLACIKKNNEQSEVHMHRDALLKKLRNDYPAIIMTSFERGLKHAGMEVLQSTHGEVVIKIWGINKSKVPIKKKRICKRSQRDSNYSDGSE